MIFWENKKNEIKRLCGLKNSQEEDSDIIVALYSEKFQDLGQFNMIGLTVKGSNSCHFQFCQLYPWESVHIGNEFAYLGAYLFKVP